MPDRRESKPVYIFTPAAILALLLFLAMCRALPLRAQEAGDSLIRAHSPTRAAILSALLPGAGQLYNKKYWKIPVLYGAFAGLGYLVKFNDDRFQVYKRAYILRLDGLPETVDEFADRYSDGDLKALRDFYRRNRDLSLIFGGLVYVLNIVDASVDAHLFYFDVSDDLSLYVEPSADPALRGQVAGLRLILAFR